MLAEEWLGRRVCGWQHPTERTASIITLEILFAALSLGRACLLLLQTLLQLDIEDHIIVEWVDHLQGYYHWLVERVSLLYGLE